MNLLEYIASRIREMRLNYGGKGISQEALAAALKVTPNTISRWETGTYKPGIEDLDKLARFFGVSILDFFPPDPATAHGPVAALLRATKDLPTEDVEELRKYAEYRRARYVLGQGIQKSVGRRRKGSG